MKTSGACLLVVAALIAAVPPPTFAQSELVGLRQIVVASQDDVAAVGDRLADGAPFESVALASSLDDASAFRGGYLGRVDISELRPEFERALAGAVPGEVLPAVRAGDLYFLFQVVPRAEALWLDADIAGGDALQEGRIDEAAVAFESAVAHAEAFGPTDPRLVRSLDSLAEAYRAIGRMAEAESLYRRVLEILESSAASPTEIAQVVNGLAMAVAAQGRYDEADPLYERAEAIRIETLGPRHPEVAAVWHNRADLLGARGRFHEAAALHEEAVAVFVEALGEGHAAVAASRERQNAFRQTVLLPALLDEFAFIVEMADFRDDALGERVAAALELVPLIPFTEQAFVQMKDIVLQSGLTEESAELLRMGLDRFPDSRVLRVYLAEVYAGTGRTADALRVLEEASGLPLPDGTDRSLDVGQRSTIQQRIGDMHQALFEYDEAVAAYERALEIAPRDPAGHLKLGKSYLSTNRVDDAIAEFERAAAEAPRDPEIPLNLAEAYLSDARADESAAAAEQAIALGTTDPRALYLLGRALIQAGRVPEGQEQLAEYQRVDAELSAEEHRNREVTAIKSEAIAAFMNGNPEAAETRLIEAIGTSTDSAGLRMTLGLVYERMGRSQDAVRVFEDMLDEGVGRAFLVHRNLADAYAVLGDSEASRRHREAYEATRSSELIMYAPQ